LKLNRFLSYKAAYWLGAMVLFLFISACAQNVPMSASPTYTAVVPTEIKPTYTAIVPTQVRQTDTPTANNQAIETPLPFYSLVTGDLASSVDHEVVEAVPASDNGPYWEPMPRYTRLTLKDYPISGHLLQPQIFIYPVKELMSANEVAGKIAEELGVVLASQRAEKRYPYLPIYNATQVITVREKYFNFKSGKGMAYLTQFDQAVMPISNHELVYTFQGLTADGKYYIAAVLPVNHPSLTKDEREISGSYEKFASEFPDYLANTVKYLNEQPDSSFTPDLSTLDSMLRSLEVK
jgi:hypothetical protein